MNRFQIEALACGLTVLAVSVSFNVGDRAAAADFYVSQTSSGITNSMAWLNSAEAWGSATNEIGPGDTVHLCGSITNTITIGGSGSYGNPITLLFEPNAIMTSPAWTNCAIFGGAYHDIVIDGGSNGIINSTSNGTALPLQVGSKGILFYEASRVTVKNLTIENLFVRTAGTNVSGGGIGIQFKWNGGGSFGSDLVTNCVFHDMSTGLSIGYGPNCTNFEMSGCTAYNVNMGGNAGDNGSLTLLNGLTVSNNRFYSWSNWDGTDDLSQKTWHHNGFYAWAETGGSLSNVTYSGNFIGPGFGGVCQTSGLFVSGRAWNTMVYNNLIIAPDGTCPADGFIFLWICHSVATASTASVFNNTIVGGGKGTGIEFFQGFGSNLTTYFSENNLIQNVATAITVYSNFDSTLISSHNSFYEVPFSTICYSSATGSAGWATSIADWQALGYDLNLITNNPELSANYTLVSDSPTIGAGANLTSLGITNDFNGNPRPATGPWDIGAYEYYIMLPVFQGVQHTGGNIAFTWSAIVGKNYQFQTATNLNGGNWQSNGLITATNSIMSWSDIMDPDPQRFYRLLVE